VATSDPVYLRVVEDIRRQIVDGSLPPGAPIPSRAQLTRRYGVGETAARHALRVLATEGLIYGRVGSGHYVREKPVLVPLHRWQLSDPQQTPAGIRATWDWRSEQIRADADIAARLRVEEAAPLTRTRYVFRGDGRPFQLATSYELAELAGGHDMPAEGVNGRPNPVTRLSALGVKITEIVESVSTRVPQPAESDALNLPAGVHVLHVERTHWTADRPVETSDIVIPGDRFRLVYTTPVHL
jgi:GntR family transcriptional regulator